MKLLFCGTPQFARTVLESIHDAFPCAKLFVVSSPARKQGRGMTLTQPPVASFALEHNLPLYQPETLKNEAFLPVLEEICPDIAIVAAYGKILPPYFISFPKYGCMNVHASLLPAYRGASPIQCAIRDGLEKTGVSIMQMDNGLDTGDVLMTEETAISPLDNTETLTEKLAVSGAKLICDAIRAAFDGTLTPKKQDDNLATYASKILRADEAIDFNDPVAKIDAMIRALAPNPYANAKLPDGSELKICLACPTEFKASAPGYVRVQKSRVFVSCADFELQLLKVKPQGKGVMDASALVNGRKLKDGDVLK